MLQSVSMTLKVRNLAESVRFYSVLPGFQLIKTFDDQWADLEGPGFALGLKPVNHEIVKSNNFQIALRVNNISGAIDFLTKNKIPFRQHKSKNESLLFFNDPDGHSLYFIQSEWE